ncbi:MAG: porphobilinogen synthase [Chloroflexi bacterium]|nr:porphobilinogen synthase [Chloroflexota bacterium]HCU73256.1 porphobilinogen synthase [Chloroflexota bacterium]
MFADEGSRPVRLRRLRKTPALRALVREIRVSAQQLVYPVFVVPGSGVKSEIDSMPGQFHWSVDRVADAARSAADAGVGGLLLFGQAAIKSPSGSEASDSDGVTQQAIEVIKAAVPDLVLCTDVCLCSYTDHGHCGVLVGDEVDNDASVDRVAQVALSHAQAGADVVAPSDMMDGRVRAVRTLLDSEGFIDVSIMAYAAKYASAFYGPFRDAADSAPMFGDRHGYQLDPANIREAIREVELDVAEGADIVIVKPGLTYLDVVAQVRSQFDVPVAAYVVSGEYAAIKAAASRGWLDERTAFMETLTSVARAGADVIITYSAIDVARWMTESRSR